MGSRVGADVGGTFTDVIVEGPDGRTTTRKVLSTPPSYDKAVTVAIDALLGESPHSALRPVQEVVHGTTVATNAILERRGAHVALVTTEGFRDVLELRRVRMPHLYNPFWRKPPPIVERRLRFEIGERMLADGTAHRPVDEAEVVEVAARLRDEQVEAVAVCLLHAHKHPAHEEQVARILRRELPGVPVVLSSEVLREQNEYERSATTALNAYVIPIMGSYVRDLVDGLEGIGVDAPVLIMQSSGGAMTAADAARRPVYALESGPAAGVVAAQGLARELGIENAISFDMGGTTAKASLIEEGRVTLSREYEVGADLSVGTRLLRGSGELLRVPSIDIAEVGAGGGSVAWVDSAGGLQVGPRSAGAVPGPACYGLGGDDPTVTDANVVLGYVRSGPLAGDAVSISPELARRAVKTVADPLAIPLAEAARGVHDLANARMMRALRAVSSERGRDPREFALIAFGGAGPIHAASLATELGIDTVVVPPDAGVFSAAGLLYARPEYHDVRFCELDARDPSVVTTISGLFDELESQLASSIAGGVIEWVRSADMRYKGQSFDIEVTTPETEMTAAALADLVEAFEDRHEQLYGVRKDPDDPIEVRAVRLAALGPLPRTERVTDGPDLAGRSHRRAKTHISRPALFALADGYLDAPVLSRRSDLGPDGLAGPLLIDEYDTTIVIPPGWIARWHRSGALFLARQEAGRAAVAHTDVVTRQIVANALASAADEMATTIFRTAHSTVVRDAMDFSAALLGPDAQTVAQAVTIPFHLGAVPTAVDALLARFRDRMRPGDVFIMNDPFDGGMHLPDVFVVKPVYYEDTLIGYGVATAHHGDIGGRLLGSSATDNTEVFQDGLRIPWMHLYKEGRPVEEVHALIRANVRVPHMLFGDLGAQVAACSVGERALQAMVERYGIEHLAELMDGLIDYTEVLMRREISSWPDGTASFTDYMDSDGIESRDVAIRVKVTIEADEVGVDLSDSDPMVRGSLNATRSFIMATAYHCVMSASASEFPNTAGAFRPVRIITKPGTVTHAVYPGANSMRGVTGFRAFDAINGALAQLVPDRVPAAGEGGNTVVILGGHHEDGEPFVYFELLVGTWGATPGNDGNDGLSNPIATAANVPIEVAEAEFPIIIERYGLVPDSGGAGLHRGGLCLEKSWRPLVPTSLLIRSDRQRHPPFGLMGGSAGGHSSNTVVRLSGEEQAFPPMFSDGLAAGELYHHIQPGGGGWGDPLQRHPRRVADDVRNGKVGREGAREDYGVILDEDLVVDAEATAATRRRMGGERE
ncbi:MAG: hydantoinase B/oxoprolinase family protein [bacterium]|nr:hydantoinase B/oxoprolinase family protein [bacterium]MDE0290148.1 hydantoinase B/oxoprolinase family protein [bacterium]MDE0438933.1 hydantoinase B/oxoprolinase family protein [bacterium]